MSSEDIRNIISDDDLLQEGIQPALREYNIEQFTVVDVPETNYQVYRAPLTYARSFDTLITSP